MCTASWFFAAEGYGVFFNRDEQRSRALALAPQVMDVGADNQALMPVDPVGGGSWIGVNQQGVTLALLNFYQGTIPAGPLMSRGGIVKAGLACRSLSELTEMIETLPLANVAPFSLLCFFPAHAPDKPREQCEVDNRILMWRWSGEKLQRLSAASVMVSSAKFFRAVAAGRQAVAQDLGLLGGVGTMSVTAAAARCNVHRAYHWGHRPQKSAYSVCMHREDAHTVSYSEILVNNHQATFNYSAGAPCSADVIAAPPLTIVAAEL